MSDEANQVDEAADGEAKDQTGDQPSVSEANAPADATTPPPSEIDGEAVEIEGNLPPADDATEADADGEASADTDSPGLSGRFPSIRKPQGPLLENPRARLAAAALAGAVIVGRWAWALPSSVALNPWMRR